jgi:hypothetical protein
MSAGSAEPAALVSGEVRLAEIMATVGLLLSRVDEL